MKRPLRSPITLRATLVGILLIPFNSYWILHLSYIWDSNRPTSLALLFNVLFTLLVLIALNTLLRRVRPTFAFSQTELLTIYAMLCQASVFAGRDMLQVLVPIMGNGFWYATPENEWAQLFHQHLPEWLIVGDMDILNGFYRGESTFYLQPHIQAWLIPSMIWVGFCLVIGTTMLCINVLLRRQWQEHERLTYPIAQLPLEITQGQSRFFNRRTMTVGICIAAILNLLYSLHQIDPIFPTIPLYHNFRLTEKPWSAMNNPGFRISFFPFAIGVGFLIPLDLGFSCWFFHLFWHFQRITGESFGWRSAIGFPREMAQIRGVWIALFLWTMWMGRTHFKSVIQMLFGNHLHKDSDEGEALRYRTAMIGATIGLVVILLFCLKAGMSLWFAFLFFLIYFCMSITITRIRAELGPPAHDLYNAGADLLLVDAFGTRRIGNRNLSVMSLFFWLNHLSYRAHPMPHQLEALKLAHQTRFNPKQLLWVLAIAIFVGALSAAWGHLHLSYQVGLENARSWYARAAFNRLAGWLYNPSDTNLSGMFYTFGGFMFALSLLFLRWRFIQFPLHPVGYVVSSWWTFTGLWFPLLISWTVKRILLSTGGVKLYRRAIPFFIGLVIGDVIVASVISILGLFLNFQVRYLSW
ncbi:hypothetical protein C6497_03395 [Candidatus Poribacteria bacterium]|nr:MAG: hypothetical protein C6497_03395 [Candidatus Poribacteria bacterium]